MIERGVHMEARSVPTMGTEGFTCAVFLTVDRTLSRSNETTPDALAGDAAVNVPRKLCHFAPQIQPIDATLDRWREHWVEGDEGVE